MASCDIKSGACETPATSQGECSSTPCASKCACGGGCGGDPVVCASLMWECAFKTAMKEVMVETLKPRIQKVMGPKFEKTADAVIAAMLVKFQSMVAVSDAKAKLRDTLRSIITEGK